MTQLRKGIATWLLALAQRLWPRGDRKVQSAIIDLGKAMAE